ncbi:galactonate dehydratase [Pricia antarctica]|uniref:Galactonate dehydratase n=1 Tax=Pricia antarctica TaxID=641691 RepID=A0A1G7F8Q5_9FLAO|nr:galactonate dehydratase [Pricia antarctica]SDE72282.1 galactonate dehydratase [Pricia antarctica]
METLGNNSNKRRDFLKGTVTTAVAATVGITGLSAAAPKPFVGTPLIGPKDKIKITKVETFVLKNSWVFVKISTDAGITGWGEMLKDDAKACAAGAMEVGSTYLIGKDPRPVVKHWQAIHRGAFYRGGPIKTAIVSGIDQALWDIKGKALGVPVYELLGGPTRDKALVYGTEPDFKTGVRHMKVGPKGSRSPFKYNEGTKMIDEVVERFAALKAQYPDVDIAIDFHGSVQPTTASSLIKALEPHRPWFLEEVVQALNVDVMADLAKKTLVPLATGERIFTKWGFREILEKGAAMILQPDVNYAGGITELKIIAGMAEAYYAPIAPHNPNGPCSLAASLQIAACVPNFLVQERGNREHELLAVPLPPVVDGYRPIPTGPGLGITIDENKLMNEVGEPRPYLPKFDPDDNSVIDW